MPKLSVIIPVYNREKYLKCCIDSLLNQTFKDIEFIFVDDGSTDKSLEILEKYKQLNKDKIKIIKNDKNMGPGYSRNRGLEVVYSNYVGFVDSDDYIDSNMYEIMYNQAINNHDDIVQIKRNLIWHGIDLSFMMRKNNLNSGIFNPKENKNIILESSPNCCDKIFKRELIGDNKFPENLKWEDLPFSMLLMMLSNTVEFLNDSYYHYRMEHNNTTITDLKKINNNILDIFDVCDILEQKLKENNIIDNYEEELRTLQIVNSLTRVRDLGFIKIPLEKKKELINLLIMLINKKYGNWENNDWFINKLQNSFVYNFRFQQVLKYYEKSYSDSMNECDLKQKIKTLL